MNNKEYTHNASVIFPLMYLASFRVSAMAANGIPQLATGPQKWVLIIRWLGQNTFKTHELDVCCQLVGSRIDYCILTS